MSIIYGSMVGGGGSGGSSIAIDETLTEQGKAADAKATGDTIRSLSEEIAGLQGALGSYITDVAELVGGDA